MFLIQKHLRMRRLGVAAAALAALSLTFAACDNPLVPLPEEGAPDVLEFAIGGFGAASYDVEVRGDTVVYRHYPWGDTSTPVDVVRAVPTADQWRAFWAATDEAGVGRWQRRYRAENIVDGSGWGLRLQAGGESIVSEGSNAYPDRNGDERENEVTQAFLIFLDALGDLVGESIY